MSLWIPSFAPALLALAPTATPAQDAQDVGYSLRVTVPDLAIEGEPWRMSVEVTAVADRAIELPLWALTSAAVEFDGRAVGERATGTLALAPGQRVSTSLDLGPLALAASTAPAGGRPAELPTERKVGHALGGGVTNVQWLRRAETGIDFMALPVEQLADYQVVLMTTAGPLWLEFWPDVAPNHVRNFLDLAYTGFYDGSKFHRVIPGFMVQGGRGGDGREAPRKVKQEFSTRRHVPGVLSAARLGNDNDSATSEFFLVHMASPDLDGQYTTYGALVASYAKSFETVENIVKAVDANYKLLGELRRAAPIDPNHVVVQMAVNNPNPPQVITKAIVVKAPRKR